MGGGRTGFGPVKKRAAFCSIYPSFTRRGTILGEKVRNSRLKFQIEKLKPFKIFFKNIFEKYFSKIFYKNIFQKYFTKIFFKNILQKCFTKVFFKNFLKTFNPWIREKIGSWHRIFLTRIVALFVFLNTVVPRVSLFIS